MYELPIFTYDKDGSMVYVYFIKSGDFIKIGKSTDPNERLKHLQIGNPEKLKLIATSAVVPEKSFHDMLSEHRVTGEWFKNNEEVSEVMEMYKSDHYNLSLKTKSELMDLVLLLRDELKVFKKVKDLLPSLSNIIDDFKEGLDAYYI